MELKKVVAGDVVEYKGKKYRAVKEPTPLCCLGCDLYTEEGLLCLDRSWRCAVIDHIILKEVKETPRRHIELGVVKVEGDNVTFRIVEQTHRGKNFSQQTDTDIFKASKIVLKFKNLPEWGGDNFTLFCRGFSSDKDNIEIVCTTSEFTKISEAITEYNATDGKGYEKSWPQTGDEYFQIASNGEIGRDIFRGGDWDTGLQNFGNFFRTYKEAEAARDKVKTLLKDLAAK